MKLILVINKNYIHMIDNFQGHKKFPYYLMDPKSKLVK